MAGIYDRTMFRDAAPMAAGGLMINALEQAGALRPVEDGLTNLAGAVPGSNMAALFMQMYGRAPSPEELQSFMASNPTGMADGGMVPPMAEDMPLMMPEEEAAIYQEAQNLPPEVLQAADQELQAAAGELSEEGVANAVNEEVSRAISNIDMAGDFRDLMNVVWEEDADIDTYRAKLAQVVGEEDANRTPDSVLTLVQPTLQLAEIDQGVGSLMQEELQELGGMEDLGGIASVGSQGVVADGMAAETGALVNAVGGMSRGQGIMDVAPEATGVDPMVLQAMMQGAGPMGQGMA